MKKILYPFLILLMFALAACGGEAVVDQARATAEGVVQDVSDAAEEIVDSVNEEPSETTEEPTTPDVACNPDEIPDPSADMVHLRFVNNSGGEMSIVWHDTQQAPSQLTEYTRLAAGETHDQLTFVGHEWLLQDEHGDMLTDYVASAEPKQCVSVYPHFSYEGGEPQEWAELSKHYETCGSGQQQSPIDLTNATMSDVENIVFDYGETAVDIINNGHTIQVNVVPGSKIVIDNISYPLKQFHFHAPSEHEVAGQPYPIEIHLVHIIPGKPVKIAVVGIFIVEGAENEAFIPVWEHLPEEEIGIIATGATVELDALLPADQLIYRYSGSLTTPPCSEDVIWSVMQNPVEMSPDQIAAFTQIINGNNRPVQPLNARVLESDNTP